MFKICFYVPEAQLEQVKQALFQAGAGKIGNYEHCAWETEGKGQFKPLNGSTPHIGQHNLLERVKEIKVEIVCEDELIQHAITTLRQAHPYEEPAYQVWPLHTFL